MNDNKLPPASIVEIAYDDKIIEVQYADGSIYSKERLAHCSQFMPGFNAGDSYYYTAHEEFAAEIKTFSVNYLRKQSSRSSS